MSTVTIGIGVPGSGKTTMLKPLAESMFAVYVCLDDIREELCGTASDQSKDQEAVQVSRERIKAAIAAGKDVVYDANNANPKYRCEIIKFCRDAGAARIQGMWFKPHWRVAAARNRTRVRVIPDLDVGRMIGMLEAAPPHVREGFDELVIHD